MGNSARYSSAFDRFHNVNERFTLYNNRIQEVCKSKAVRNTTSYNKF